MRWTKDRPASPGFWWCSRPGKCPEHRVVEVFENGAIGRFLASWDGDVLELWDETIRSWGDAPVPLPDWEVPS